MRALGLTIGLFCVNLNAENVPENRSASQEMVSHLATVAKELERRPAIVLNLQKLGETNLVGVAKNGKGDVFAVGVRGAVLHSADGIHWRQMSVPTDVTFTAIYFDARGDGWLGGHEGTIMHLPSGANEWQLVRTDPGFDGPILDFIFFDEQVGLALSSGGMIFRTVNGGKDWLVSEIVTEDFFNPHLFSAVLTDTKVAFLAGERGTIFRSNDLGVSWTELPSPFIGSLFGIVGFGDGLLLAYGITGHVFYSANNGDSWIAIETGVKDSLFAHIVDDGNVLLLGADGVALRLAPGASGAPTVTQMEKVGRFTISSLAQGPDGQVLAASNQGIQKLALRGR